MAEPASTTSETPSAAPAGTGWVRPVLPILGAQIVVLVVLGWTHRFQVDADAVAYLRIAEYYVNGRFDLAITGYWGPMLSWLIGLLRLVGLTPLVAARLVMAFSALVFTLGGVAVFRTLGLPRPWLVLGTGIVALMSARYSVFVISPDLLLGGALCLATALVLSPAWPVRPRRQVAAGVVAGVAYFAKAVALPVFGGLVVCVSAVWLICRAPGLGRKRIALAAAVTLGAATVTAAPWIAVLSAKYDGLVLSTSARVGRAVLNPDPAGRGHPIGKTFAWPEEGRLSNWEEPTVLTYHYWSPFESAMHFRHQVKIMGGNAAFVVRYLREHDAISLGLFCLVVGLVVHGPWRRNMLTDRWRWSGIAVFAFCGVYVPVFAISERYYFASLPFLFAAAAGLVLSLTGGPSRAWSPGRVAGYAVLALSFGIPHLLVLGGLLGKPPGRPVSMRFAERLERHGITGSVAADHVDAAMVAYFLDRPSCGNVPSKPAASYCATGADLVILARAARAAQQMVAETAYQDLDAVLFDSAIEAEAFPLRAFRRPPPDQAAAVSRGDAP